MSITKQLRRGLLFALAILAGSLALAVPSRAQAAAGLQPIELRVIDAEDRCAWCWPDDTDEVQIYYGGQKWSGNIREGASSRGPFPVARF